MPIQITATHAGSQHYQRAEIAQDAAAAMQASRVGAPAYTPTEALLDALVHATLALTAAVVDASYDHISAAADEAWTAALHRPAAT